MKKIFPIALCFALTFILGGFAGWLLKPAPPAPVAPAAVATPTALPPGDALLQRLDERLHFSGEQKEKLRPLCDELGKEMEAAGNRMDWRREIFNTYAPRIREQLTTNQLAAYDQMVAEQLARRARQRQ